MQHDSNIVASLLVVPMATDYNLIGMLWSRRFYSIKHSQHIPSQIHRVTNANNRQNTKSPLTLLTQYKTVNVYVASHILVQGLIY